jgi:hypothetical protein
MTVLATDRSGYWPPSFEQTADGNLFVANGIDDTLRIRGYAQSATLAGIEAPETALTLGFSGTGTIDGDYYAYSRFVDADGIPSSLSPISTVAVALDHSTANYSNIPVSSNTRVTTVEIYRNTDGQTIVFYLDATVTNGTTSTTSTKTDAQLQASTALPILNADGSINANRFEPPPYHKAVLVQHQDRMWFAVDVAYTQGNVQVDPNSTTVEGLGTGWTENFIGRTLHLPYSGDEYEITDVDVAAQTLEIDTAWTGLQQHFTYYAILPERDERNKVYFSHVGEPESVPAQNNFKIQELGGDELTGLMPLGQFLFVLMRRHVYRISFGISPNDDIAVHKTVSRGCVNQRCWQRVEDVAYLLDREGVHRFEGGHDGGRTEHVSESIQDYFREERINWAAERFFFASHNAIEEVVRFHVALGGHYLPRHALCYHYRHQAWWVEEYPLAWGGACVPWMAGFQRTLVSGQYGEHYIQSEENLDLVRSVGDSETYRAFVDSATLTSITDDDAVWPQGLVNAPISIVTGSGRGQQNRIVSVDGQRLNLRNPWREMPGTDSEYQLGAVPWRIVGGTYRFVQEHQADKFENMNLRRIYVACQPTEEDAHINLRLFLDHNPDPKSDYVTYSGDDGVSTLLNDPYIVLNIGDADFSGYRQFDISQQLVDPRFAHNWITPELSGYQGRSPVVLYTLGVGGAQ